MNLIIKDQGENHITFIDERGTEFFVYSGTAGYITTLLQNSSHRAYKGGGKTHWSWADAEGAYKRADLKAAIRFAAQTFAA